MSKEHERDMKQIGTSSMIEAMKEMKEECYILTNIKRRKRKIKMNINIDICRIDSIRRVSKDAGLVIKFGIDCPVFEIWLMVSS